MTRRRRKQEESGEDQFIVLFTALSMILLAFFIMLNAMATIDASRSRAAMNSLIGTFGSLPGFEKEKLTLEFEHESVSVQGDAGRAIHRIREALGLDERQLEELSIDELEDGRIVVGLATPLLFDVGGVILSPRSFRTLDTIGGLIEELQLPVRIEGHADSTPARGARSNWYFSAARAAAVFRYLDENFEIDPARLHAIGYADVRPDQQGNRRPRVEFVFFDARVKSP